LMHIVVNLIVERLQLFKYNCHFILPQYSHLIY
jgi:hypothetical protein